MAEKQISGFWILEKRLELPELSDTSFSISDRIYQVKIPEIEILYFSDKQDKCYQIGINNRSENERQDSDYDEIYEEISFLSGRYDLVNNFIELSEKGRLDILSNGTISIITYDDDYKCEEIWAQLKDKEIHLISFLKSFTKDL